MEGCKKKAFKSRELATARLKEIASTSTRKDKPRRVYQCDKCGKYHLTSFTKKQQKEIEFSKTPQGKAVAQIRRISKIADYWMKKMNWTSK